MRTSILLAIVFAGMTLVQSPVERTLVLSVVDEGGTPVTDLQSDDVRVREGGTDAEVVSLKRATGPLFVQVLVDTTPTTEPHVSEIRKALAAFVSHLKQGDPSAEIGLMEFGQAAVPIVGITSDAEALDKAIRRIFPKPRSASVLLEAIIAASNSLAPRSTRRRAIVTFNMEPSDEQSQQSPKQLLQALALSGAQVWSISLQTGNRNNANRDIVLNEVARVSGGRREVIVSASAIDMYLKRYANALLAQYELTYRITNRKQSQVVQTGTTRPGTRVHASTFLPQ